jgi:hypothetical protein
MVTHVDQTWKLIHKDLLVLDKKLGQLDMESKVNDA